MTYHRRVVEDCLYGDELDPPWAFAMLGMHTVDLEEEEWFDGGVESEKWKTVSDLGLKLHVRKITRGTLVVDPDIVHAGATNFHAGNPDADPRQVFESTRGEIEMARDPI